MISRPAAWNWIITSRTDFKEWKVLPLAFDLSLSGQKSCFFFPLRPLPAESQPLDDSFKNVTHEKSALSLYSPRGPKFCLVFFSRGKRVGWKRCMMCDVFSFCLGRLGCKQSIQSFPGSTLSYLHSYYICYCCYTNPLQIMVNKMAWMGNSDAESLLCLSNDALRTWKVGMWMFLESWFNSHSKQLVANEDVSHFSIWTSSRKTSIPVVKPMDMLDMFTRYLLPAGLLESWSICFFRAQFCPSRFLLKVLLGKSFC